jgi:hypothetical protein
MPAQIEEQVSGGSPMSHISWGLTNEECLDEMILSFIRNTSNSKVNSDCISKMMLPAYKIKSDD